MKKRKIVTYILFTVGAAALLWVGNAFLGNPISHALASRTARQYLLERFPDSDYEITSVMYSFKSGNYHAHIESPTSRDGYFSLALDMQGQMKYDTYDSVENGWNTAQRLDREYRKLTDTVLNDPALPYDNQSIHSILFGSLETTSREFLEDPNIKDIPPYALIQEELILDQQYDIRELVAQAGHLVLYVDSDEITYEEAARIMLDFKDRFDRAEIPFYAMDFILRSPRVEGAVQTESSLDIRDFLYRDLYPEGLEERIRQVHQGTLEYYDSMDK